MQTTPMSATIRPATDGDYPRIERLLLESELPTVGVREALGDFFVAQAGDDVVGVAGLEPCGGDALLRSVAVRPEWRSKGVGRAIVTHAINAAEARGCRALYLLTTTAETYFPGFGFHPVGRDQVPAEVRATQEFTSACPESATAMEKVLDSRASAPAH